MTSLLTKTCTTIHFSALEALSLYGVHRVWLILHWLRQRGVPKSTPPSLPETLPLVTVQLPIYNERFVAEGLLDAVARLNWPQDKLEIQVLDDSTDDTTELVAVKVASLREAGLMVQHLRRSNRQGFKAGALSKGLDSSKAEFLAIFDADFTPEPDFLLKTIPHFGDPKVGMVQARWGFRNADHSLLTGVQSLLLGPHFTIEHQVRFRRGLFFNFNGTAGVWRRSAIEAAGGWQADTVTEDLDLSYRAQLAGWRFVYLDDYSVPSELPATLAAFRSQQQRWAKGSLQTARRILPHLLRKDLPANVKCEAMSHLLANICWVLGTVTFLTLYPTIISRVGVGPWQMLRLDLPLFLATTCAILAYFFAYLVTCRQKGSWRWFLALPMVSIGLAPAISLSVLNGLLTKGGFFERTPKFGIIGKSRLPRQAFLYRQKGLPYLVLNLLLLSYSILPLLFAYQQKTWYALPLFALFPAGFLLVLAEEVRGIKSN